MICLTAVQCSPASNPRDVFHILRSAQNNHDAPPHCRLLDKCSVSRDAQNTLSTMVSQSHQAKEWQILLGTCSILCWPTVLKPLTFTQNCRIGAKRLMPRIVLNNSRASMTAARNVFTRLELAEEAQHFSQHMKWTTVTFAKKKT